MTSTKELRKLAIKLKAHQVLEKQQQERQKNLWEPPEGFSMR